MVEVTPIDFLTTLNLNLQEFFTYFEKNRKCKMDGYEIRNFRKHANDGLPFFSMELKRLVANIPWTMHFEKATYDNKDYLDITLTAHCETPTRHITSIGILIPHSTDSSKNIEHTVRFMDVHPDLRYLIGRERDERKSIDKLTKGGYIQKNGSLVIYVALEVIFMINEPHLPMFNFYDAVNFEKNKVFIFQFSDGRRLYADKRILCRHSEMLAEHIKVKRLKTIDVDDGSLGPDLGFRTLEKLLQLAYGVRRNSDRDYSVKLEMIAALKVAKQFEMKSIHRACENHWLQDDYQEWSTFYLSDMPRLAKQILKNVDTVGKMKEMLSICDFDLMSTDLKRVVMQKIYGLRDSI